MPARDPVYIWMHQHRQGQRTLSWRLNYTHSILKAVRNQRLASTILGARLDHEVPEAADQSDPGGLP